MRKVAIYRHQLFKPSEPFIEEQAGHLQGFHPILVGRERLGQGSKGLDNVVLADGWSVEGPIARAYHALTMDSAPMARLLRQHGAELVHAHFGVDAVYAERVASALSVPLVTTFHGYDATASRRAHLSSRSPARVNYVLRRRRLLERGGAFLCVSDFIRRKVLELGFPESGTQVHYIGVDTSRIVPGRARAATPVILHVGRLVEVKGGRTLLNAFAKVVKRYPDAELQIVGAGPLEAELRSQAVALGVADRTTMLGARPRHEVIELIQRSWVVCLPSNSTSTGETEGFGIVLLEAAATGTPVVATRHGGIPEAVEDGVTGLLAQERDADAIADHLCTMLANGSLREHMGAAARRRVEEKFDVVKQSASLSEIYRGLL